MVNFCKLFKLPVFAQCYEAKSSAVLTIPAAVSRHAIFSLPRPGRLWPPHRPDQSPGCLGLGRGLAGLQGLGPSLDRAGRALCHRGRHGHLAGSRRAHERPCPRGAAAWDRVDGDRTWQRRGHQRAAEPGPVHDGAGEGRFGGLRRRERERPAFLGRDAHAHRSGEGHAFYCGAGQDGRAGRGQPRHRPGHLAQDRPADRCRRRPERERWRAWRPVGVGRGPARAGHPCGAPIPRTRTRRRCSASRSGHCCRGERARGRRGGTYGRDHYGSPGSSGSVCRSGLHDVLRQSLAGQHGPVRCWHAQPRLAGREPDASVAIPGGPGCHDRHHYDRCHSSTHIGGQHACSSQRRDCVCRQPGEHDRGNAHDLRAAVACAWRPGLACFTRNQAGTGSVGGIQTGQRRGSRVDRTACWTTWSWRPDLACDASSRQPASSCGYPVYSSSYSCSSDAGGTYSCCSCDSRTGSHTRTGSPANTGSDPESRYHPRAGLHTCGNPDDR